MNGPLRRVSFVCLDCEMTGLDPLNDRIIEVAAVHFTLEALGETYETLIDPERPIPAESLAIHNISSVMLLGKPKIAEILPHFFDFIGKAPLVGHAIPFDLEMLARAAERAHIPYPLAHSPIIDTLRLARLYGDSPNNSLDTLAAHFNVPREGAHRALQDVHTNIAVFKHLAHRYKNLADILQALAQPIKMKYMPLGKYKGRLFSEIPLHYLQWAAKMDFDQDLLYSIRAELKKRKQGDSFAQAGNPFSQL